MIKEKERRRIEKELKNMTRIGCTNWPADATPLDRFRRNREQSLRTRPSALLLYAIHRLSMCAAARGRHRTRR